jgi:hypothetical protein
MPYLIWVPHNPRPYISNDPRIFMDAKSWSWRPESRPYTDAFCVALRRQENARYESERRAGRLEQCWLAELERRRQSKEAAPVMTMKVPVKHAKHDSVQGIIVEVKELELEEDCMRL